MDDLGELISVHPTRILRILLKTFYALFTFGFTLLLIYLLRSATTFQWYNLVIAVLVVMFAAASLMFVRSLVSLLWNNPRVELYEGGLRRVTRHNSTAWRWNDFETLRIYIDNAGLYGVPLYTFGDYGLFIGGEKVLSLNYDYHRIKWLHEVVFTKTAETFAPRYTAQYNRGEPVEFSSAAKIVHGKNAIPDYVVVDTSGIRAASQFIPWAEINGTNVASGYLMLHRNNRGTPTQIPVAMQHNGHVMAMFIEAVMSGTSSQLRPIQRSAPVASEPLPRWRTVLRLQTGKFGILFAMIAGLGIAGVIVILRYHDIALLVAVFPITLALLVWMALSSLLAYGRSLSETPDKFSLRLKTRFRDRTWDWEDLSDLTLRRTGIIPIFPAPSYVLYADKRKALSINRFDLVDGDKWISTLIQKQYQQWLGEYRTQFQKGKVIQFGKVTISQEQICRGRRKLDWNHIQSYQWVNNELVFEVTRQKRPWKFSTYGIPNVYILNVLIRDKVGDAGKLR